MREVSLFRFGNPLPYINPEILECAVYLYPSEAAAEDGEHMGGTGFLIAFPADPEGHDSVLAVVTNRHVVDDGNMVVRLNTISGSTDILALDNQDWYFHPDGDDLAICPIRLTKSHSAKFVSSRMFLKKEDVDQWDIGPGDDIFVVGRFVNHEGKQRNLPSLRFGNIAQMPWEPIISDGRPQESFLVECRSISGYSGSPVFLWMENPVPPNITKEGRQLILDGKMSVVGVSPKRLGMTGGGWPIGLFLLGINYSYLRFKEPIRNGVGQQMHDWYVNTNTGMMGVIPAWKLMDIINGRQMKR
jgi:hypothetical protein